MGSLHVETLVIRIRWYIQSNVSQTIYTYVILEGMDKAY